MTGEERQTVRQMIDRLRRQQLGVVAAAPRRSTLEPRRQCGPRHVEAMRRAYALLGVASQAEAARLGDVPSGARTWATRALVDEGAIRPTGRLRDRSPEYETCGAGAVMS